MARYALTTQAQQSLEKIKAFSIERFGQPQTSIYLANLRDKMGFLAKNPRLGVKRTDIFSDWICYSYVAGAHTIYYEVISASEIAVIDVLHQSMEPHRHLSGEQ